MAWQHCCILQPISPLIPGHQGAQTVQGTILQIIAQHTVSHTHKAHHNINKHVPTLMYTQTVPSTPSHSPYVCFTWCSPLYSQLLSFCITASHFLTVAVLKHVVITLSLSCLSAAAAVFTDSSNVPPCQAPFFWNRSLPLSWLLFSP